MKITIPGILNETPFILDIWAARLLVCHGIINNFTDQKIQAVIDFKDKRVTDIYDDNGYADLVKIVWEQYCEKDFNSSYWHHANLEFISNFIVKAAARYKKCRMELKKKKIIELKNDVIKLQKDLDNGVD